MLFTTLLLHSVFIEAGHGGLVGKRLSRYSVAHGVTFAGRCVSDGQKGGSGSRFGGAPRCVVHGTNVLSDVREAGAGSPSSHQGAGCTLSFYSLNCHPRVSFSFSTGKHGENRALRCLDREKGQAGIRTAWPCNVLTGNDLAPLNGNFKPRSGQSLNYILEGRFFESYRHTLLSVT